MDHRRGLAHPDRLRHRPGHPDRVARSLPPGTSRRRPRAFVTQHSLALSGLQPNTTYYYLVSSDGCGRQHHHGGAAHFTVPGPTLRDTAATDFAAGTTTSHLRLADRRRRSDPRADGRHASSPARRCRTAGSRCPGTSEGSAAIVDGVLLVDGARVPAAPTRRRARLKHWTARPAATCSPVRCRSSSRRTSPATPSSTRASASCSASTSEPWAIFSTLSGGMLFARTNTGNGAYRYAARHGPTRGVPPLPDRLEGRRASPTTSTACWSRRTTSVVARTDAPGGRERLQPVRRRSSSSTGCGCSPARRRARSCRASSTPTRSWTGRPSSGRRMTPPAPALQISVRTGNTLDAGRQLDRPGRPRRSGCAVAATHNTSSTAPT